MTNQTINGKVTTQTKIVSSWPYNWIFSEGTDLPNILGLITAISIVFANSF